MSKAEEEYDGSFSYRMEGDNYIRVCVVGNVDSGKSTLVGVLTKGLLDNGRGSSREKVFNFAHEAETGRTSSIAQEIMVFDSNQQQIFAERFVQKKNKYWTEIVPQAKKIVNLIDLCGHEKYLKTTIVGMVGMIPEYTLIVVGANAGLTKMTKEHLGIALALEIPFFIVITKIDMVDQETLKKTIAEIKKIMKAQYVGKKAFMVQPENLVAVKPFFEEGKKEEVRMIAYKEQLNAEEEEMIS